MKHVAIRAALVAAFLTGASGAWAARETSAVEIIRNLQQLQDQIAAGDTIAQAAHAKAIEHAARAFAAAPSATWQDARNARALIVYLFSGGSAPIIEEAIPASAVAAEYRMLYTGAVAYGLGDDDKARAALLPIDAKGLSVDLGGHLALVQATLCASVDRKKAIALLDLARLLEPGTLIEEAALRKEMETIGATGDLEKFGMLARRYVGAYSHSVYADNFRQMVATTAMQLGGSDSDQAWASLTGLASNLDKNERRRLYLVVAREAVVAGRTHMAVLAAEDAARLAAPASADEARAKVYFGAAAIVGDHHDEGEQALHKAALDRLGTRDRALQAAALSVAAMIREPAITPKSGAQDKTSAGLLVDGERTIADADALLEKARK